MLSLIFIKKRIIRIIAEVCLLIIANVPIEAVKSFHILCCQLEIKNLEILPHSLLVEVLGQDHQPPLQLVPQRHLGWGPPVLVGDGLDYGVPQENREVLAYPGRGAEMCLRLHVHSSGGRRPRLGVGSANSLESSLLPSGCLKVWFCFFW